MTKCQKLEIRSVEIRGRLSELAGIESLTEEDRSELKSKTLELRDVESQRVAALEVEALESVQEERETAPSDPETRERADILSRARVGNALKAVLDGRALSGAEAELRGAYGYSGITSYRTNSLSL